MTIVGTSNFVSERAAWQYYAQYGYTAQDVAGKLAAGEVSTGRPTILPGESLQVDPDGRYQILAP